MIYLRIKGRLGNQMFQYAFARKIQEITGEQIAIDWSDVLSMHKADGDGWENSLKLFNVCPYINAEEIPFTKLQKKLYDYCFKLKYYNNMKYLRWLFKPYSRLIQNCGLYLHQDGYFNYKVFCSEIKIIQGYFESADNFSTIDEKIKKEFEPKMPRIDKNKQLYDTIENTQSICISIRRGDFFLAENIKKYGICDENYFYNGVNKIKIQYPNATVILFSDDIKWVRENMYFGKNVFYEDGTDPVWEKLRLMYSCKHFVVSNSTFSWWAQHLSRNENKLVVAPKIWRSDNSSYEIKEKNWLII